MPRITKKYGTYPAIERYKKKAKYLEEKKNTNGWTKADKSLYHTTSWRKLRKQHLGANPWCVHCSEKGKYTIATVLDHIKPVEQGGDFWDNDNHQGLCTSCHNRKSQSEKKKN